MKRNSYNPKNNDRKDNNFQTQFQEVFEAFKKHSSTMLMVSVETGILRSNICRYIAHMRKQDMIRVVKIDACKVSNHRASYYIIA